MKMSVGTIWGVQPSKVEDTPSRGVCVMAEGGVDGTRNGSGMIGA